MKMTTKYQKGTQFEYLIKTKLEQKGYLIIRSAGSKGVFDLIAFSPKNWDERRLIYSEYHILAIQCKTIGRINKKQVEVLVKTAKTYGLIPMLATKLNRKPILINLEDNTVSLL